MPRGPFSNVPYLCSFSPGDRRSYQDLSAVFIAHRASTDALELKYSLAKMHTELLAHFLSLAREEIDRCVFLAFLKVVFGCSCARSEIGRAHV